MTAELQAAVADVMRYLHKSTDGMGVHEVYAVYRIPLSPADLLRKQAADIEAKDAAIQRLRDILGWKP